MCEVASKDGAVQPQDPSESNTPGKKMFPLSVLQFTQCARSRR